MLGLACPFRCKEKLYELHENFKIGKCFAAKQKSKSNLPADLDPKGRHITLSTAYFYNEPQQEKSQSSEDMEVLL